jgi:hypothetical protein
MHHTPPVGRAEDWLHTCIDHLAGTLVHRLHQRRCSTAQPAAPPTMNTERPRCPPDTARHRISGDQKARRRRRRHANLGERRDAFDRRTLL